MPSDNLFECWLWKALNISASSQDYRICSSICEGLSSSLLVFINSLPPSSLSSEEIPQWFFWKWIMQRNLAPWLTSSLLSHIFLGCYALPSLSYPLRKTLGPLFQAIPRNKSLNISKLQSGVRCVHVDIALFIHYMSAWERNKFKHPKATFPYISWLYFFLYFYSSQSKNKLEHTYGLKAMTVHASPIHHIPARATLSPCRARTSYKGNKATIFPNSIASWALVS